MDSPLPQPYRSDDEWLDQLTGKHGFSAQEKAHHDLSKYLYVVVFRYLVKRATRSHVLATFTHDEIAEFSQDFVQDTLEKLARNGYSLLEKYGRRGSFTSWIAQVANRIAASEVRRPYWTRRIRSGENDGTNGHETTLEENDGTSANSSGWSDVDPEDALAQSELGSAIRACRGALPDRYRIVFDHVIVHNDPVEEVAAELSVSVNAIYVIVYRVKRKMRACLVDIGLGSEET